MNVPGWMLVAGLLVLQMYLGRQRAKRLRDEQESLRKLIEAMNRSQGKAHCVACDGNVGCALHGTKGTTQPVGKKHAQQTLDMWKRFEESTAKMDEHK